MINDILDGLLKDIIIRESSSEYASPIVLTRKKNGEIRMCIDFRALNKLMTRDNYPLPLIDDQLDQLRGKRYFSRLDLKNGFYHIPMSPDSIKYTYSSCITPMGQYEFLRMPFGLKIGPQCFQRFINEVFAELIKSGNVIVYTNDILIATGRTVDEQLLVVKQVMDALVENKIELRLDKCSYLCTEIEHLGFKITRDGISPTESGIAAVVNYPTPTTPKGVQSFLGLASWFRWYIQ